ncbi:MAG: hypothetical protein IK013_02045 [Bacteroidales bacterium]|nr:hypothetical protein [Bacteroidales bacterium]
MKLLQTIKEKRQQLIRFLFGSFSATALMFAFQACYGMPKQLPPDEANILITGTITDMETGEPIEGLSITIPELEVDGTTDSTGTFYLSADYGEVDKEVTIQINDIDSTKNGLYEDLDTVFSYDELLEPFELQVRQHRVKK